MNQAGPPQLRLQKNCQRRLLNGHDWIFSNELDPACFREHKVPAGTLVHLADHRGKFLATAWFNPQTLIAARIIARTPLMAFGPDELRKRLEFAQQLRTQLYDSPYWRWVHAESDRLPGLVIDRFGPVLSVQVTSAGMEQMRDELSEILLSQPGITGLVYQDETGFRQTEGLPVRDPQFAGQVPAEIEVVENGMRFRIPATGGQKTGWFFDQRDNRSRLGRYVQGKTVADLYCYAGAWGLQAARCGASSVVCVDSSQAATAMVKSNADLNGQELESVTADALDVLKQWNEEGRQFDVVIIDPPALIKRRKDLDAGLQSYYQLNRLAAKAVCPGGILVSCSCSHHLPEEELLAIVQHAAFRDQGRSAAILEFGGQSADHPVHPAMPETRYLKALFARLT